MQRRVTLIRIEVVVNGKRNRVVYDHSDDIKDALNERDAEGPGGQPLGTFLRDMVDELLDGADTIDDGSGWSEGDAG